MHATEKTNGREGDPGPWSRLQMDPFDLNIDPRECWLFEKPRDS